MEKTFLEKQIEKRAKKRLQQEYSEMVSFVRSNPILWEAQIDNKRSFYFPEHINHSDVPEHIRESLEKRLEKLIEQETDEVLKRLDSINYLFSE